MPRIVDHANRRIEVAERAINLIAQQGIEGATVRGVAEALGFSTTIVSHYFKNKNELLLFAYRATSERALAAVRKVVSSDRQDLRGVLLTLIPTTRVRRQNWHVWFEFWGMSVGNKDIRREHAQHLRLAIGCIEDALKWRYEAAAADRRINTRDEAQRLFALVSGVAGQAVFDGSLFPVPRQIQFVDNEMARLDNLYRNN